MESRAPLICALAVLLGFGVFLGLALPAFADDEVGVATVVTICSVGACLLGAAGLLVSWRNRT